MGESYYEVLIKVADIMHFFGKYEYCNMMTNIAVWLKNYDVNYKEDLNRQVQK